MGQQEGQGRNTDFDANHEVTRLRQMSREVLKHEGMLEESKRNTYMNQDDVEAGGRRASRTKNLETDGLWAAKVDRPVVIPFHERN